MKGNNKVRWLPVLGYEKDFMVSDSGLVKRMPRILEITNERRIHLKELIYSPRDNGNGYKYIDLIKNGEKERKYLHRIVAEHFVLNPYNYNEVNHKNGIKSDNRAINLEWCNRSINTAHAYRVLGRVSTFCGKYGELNHKSKKIVAINTVTNEQLSFNSITEALKIIPISHGSAYNMLSGRKASVNGYKMKYAEGGLD